MQGRRKQIDIGAAEGVGLLKRSRVRFLGLESVLGVFGGDLKNAPTVGIEPMTSRSLGGHHIHYTTATEWNPWGYPGHIWHRTPGATLVTYGIEHLELPWAHMALNPWSYPGYIWHRTPGATLVT
ncbi:hypothetical protein DPMN_027938 [Dreissena polymorpha]|uniref:Uncharacterized protein n=1 Tax=Dreissena polymorpha TaxID=45954 RepID=A0A9D4LTT5_DREPO|nr:hypothetical protein DPMN_027938 [Dreissena polymorpha]